MVDMEKFGKDYHRDYWHKRRQRLIDYLGGECVKCGSKDNLEFDHIDKNKKSYDISKGMSLKKHKDEIDKCQLLCNTCHIEKTVKENSGIAHGSVYAWMKAKCECSICLDNKRVWQDNKNLKRRKSVDGRGPYEKNPSHGTNKMYRKGCRCPECKYAHAKYAREYRLTRSAGSNPALGTRE